MRYPEQDEEGVEIGQLGERVLGKIEECSKSDIDRY